MKNIDLRLERELHFRIGGNETVGTLFIGNLQWIENRRCWACHWSLSYVHSEGGRIYGDDPMQALTRAFDFMSSLIRGSEQDGLVIWWQFEGDHAGLTFPLCEESSWLDMPSQKPKSPES